MIRRHTPLVKLSVTHTLSLTSVIIINYLFNNTFNTFLINWNIGIRNTAMTQKAHVAQWQEERKEMFYLMTHSIHFIYGYMVSDIWQRTTQKARGKLPPPHGLLFAISRQDNTYNGLCYTSRGELAWTRNSSIGPPWRIDLTTHRTMRDCSTTELHLAPWLNDRLIRPTMDHK